MPVAAYRHTFTETKAYKHNSYSSYTSADELRIRNGGGSMFVLLQILWLTQRKGIQIFLFFFAVSLSPYTAVANESKINSTEEQKLSREI